MQRVPALALVLLLLALAGCGGASSSAPPSSSPAARDLPPAGACAGSHPAASTSSPASPSPTAASPTPVDLTLPTTIHFGDGNVGGATLTQPSTKARVSWRRALVHSETSSSLPLTEKVLADVTMPNDFYHGERIHDLTCWIYVFTAPQAFDPRILGGPAKTPTATLAPRLVWHMVAIVDASNGEFVRGFATK